MVCLSLVGHLLFMDKAFHIDDPLFLWLAESIIHNPDEPYNRLINWNGNTQYLFDFFSNPPGMSYYLAFIIHFIGDGEKLLHLAMWPFTFLAMVSVNLLAGKFIKNSLLASLFLWSSPIFLVMSTTLMPDVALIAFLMLSIYFFIEGHNKNDFLLLLLGGIAGGITMLLRYNGIIIVPLVGLYYLLYFRRNYWSIWSVFVSIAIFLSWNIYSEQVYGNMHFIHQMGFQEYGSVSRPLRKLKQLVAHLSYLGSGVAPLIILTLYLQYGKMQKKLRMTLTITFCTICSILINIFFSKYNFVNFLLLLIFLNSLGILVALWSKRALSALRRGRLQRDDIFLVGWILGTIVMHNSGLNAAAKYMLIAIPPVLILTLKLLEEHRITIIATAMCLIIATSISFFAAEADQRLANLLKEVANYYNEFGNSPVSRKYYNGHWGLQYYLQEKGHPSYESRMDCLDYDDALMLSGVLTVPSEMHCQFEGKMELIHTKYFYTDFPIHTMQYRRPSQSNFYSFFSRHTVGFLPYSISTSPSEEIHIYKVKATDAF